MAEHMAKRQDLVHQNSGNAASYMTQRLPIVGHLFRPWFCAPFLVGDPLQTPYQNPGLNAQIGVPERGGLGVLGKQFLGEGWGGER